MVLITVTIVTWADYSSSRVRDHGGGDFIFTNMLQERTLKYFFLPDKDRFLYITLMFHASMKECRVPHLSILF